MSEEPEDERSDNEKFYDDYIAPVLLTMAQDMEARGMGFVATVEYNPDEHATTVNVPATKSDAGKLTYYAARAQGNIDSVVISWVKDARQNNRAHGSIVMNQMGLDPDPAKR